MELPHARIDERITRPAFEPVRQERVAGIEGPFARRRAERLVRPPFEEMCQLQEKVTFGKRRL